MHLQYIFDNFYCTISVSILPIIQTANEVLNITCPRPQPPINGKLVTDPFKMFWSIGELLTVNCFLGFSLIGDRYLKCLSDGTFNNSLPICQGTAAKAKTAYFNFAW